MIKGNQEHAEKYLKSLQTEGELVLTELGTGNVVSQLHLRGGTPTYLRSYSDTLFTANHAQLLFNQQSTGSQ